MAAPWHCIWCGTDSTNIWTDWVKISETWTNCDVEETAAIAEFQYDECLKIFGEHNHELPSTWTKRKGPRECDFYWVQELWMVTCQRCVCKKWSHTLGKAQMVGDECARAADLFQKARESGSYLIHHQ